MSLITTPWTQEQVDALNRWQMSGFVHPFTCSEDHPLDGGYEDIMIAEFDGFHCPTCGHLQIWAHDFMLLPPVNPLEYMR
jgi:hypothetical protein